MLNRRSFVIGAGSTPFALRSATAATIGSNQPPINFRLVGDRLFTGVNFSDGTQRRFFIDTGAIYHNMASDIVVPGANLCNSRRMVERHHHTVRSCLGEIGDWFVDGQPQPRSTFIIADRGDLDGEDGVIGLPIFRDAPVLDMESCCLRPLSDRDRFEKVTASNDPRFLAIEGEIDGVKGRFHLDSGWTNWIANAHFFGLLSGPTGARMHQFSIVVMRMA